MKDPIDGCRVCGGREWNQDDYYMDNITAEIEFECITCGNQEFWAYGSYMPVPPFTFKDLWFNAKRKNFRFIICWLRLAYYFPLKCYRKIKPQEYKFIRERS